MISIVSHLHHTNSMPRSVEFIYAAKMTDGDILFADRLLHIASARREQLKLRFFLTGAGGHQLRGPAISYRRLTSKDVLEALGESDREQTVCYVCGPPQMTDELVEFLRGQQGMSADRVLCEKWW